MAADRSVVLRLDARMRAMAWGAAIIVLLVLAVSFYAGFRYGLGESGVLLQRNKSLVMQTSDYERQVSELTQQVAIAEKAAEIDRLAAEEVRQSLLAEQLQVSSLQKDLDFYRSLVAPGERQAEVALHSLELVPGQQAGDYHFSALVTQSGGGNPLVKGNISANLELEVDGERQFTPVQQLPGFTGKLPAKLRFRFFQRVEGAFALPDNARPLQIVLRVTLGGKTARELETVYSWDQLIGGA